MTKPTPDENARLLSDDELYNALAVLEEVDEAYDSIRRHYKALLREDMRRGGKFNAYLDAKADARYETAHEVEGEVDVDDE